MTNTETTSQLRRYQLLVTMESGSVQSSRVKFAADDGAIVLANDVARDPFVKSVQVFDNTDGASTSTRRDVYFAEGTHARQVQRRANLQRRPRARAW